MNLYDVPTPDASTYRALRSMRPNAVIPMPGEPVVRGDMPNTLKVWASDGTNVGYYSTGDVFTPET